MALPILDGNQSATTLSTILSSGQHIPAHTVVSLGTQAITDMRSAVSGSVVSISNFPATQPVSIASVTIGNTVTIAGTVTANPTGTQTIAGTVTANLSAIYAGEAPFTQSDNPMMAVGGLLDGFNEIRPIRIDLNTGGQIVAGTVTANLSSALPTGTNRIGVVTIGGGTVTIGAGTAQIGSVTASLQFTTTAGQIGQDGLTKILQQDPCPGLYQNDIQPYGVPIAFIDPDSQGQPTFRVVGNNGNSLPVTITTGNSRIGVVTIGAGTVTIGAGTAQIGSVTASISNSVTIASLPSISGTVTANSSNGSLTTRFGSVTTANTAFATSAVTNANRKYLLIQNVTTASNVITVGVGFTPTTTQGIQLTAGAGLTFEGSYIPTGAVNLLSSVTASCFTILEA